MFLWNFLGYNGDSQSAVVYGIIHFHALLLWNVLDFAGDSQSAV
jgi:hypothetical protein